MRNSISSEKQTIENLVGKGANKNLATFVIPDFQRPYSWKKEQVKELLVDLTNFVKSEEPEYFLGTIVVYSEDNGRTFNLVDGQQRFTTLYLICRYFHRHLENLHLVERRDLNTRSRLIGELSEILWREIARTGEYDRQDQRFVTNAFNKDQQISLKEILETGRIIEERKTNFQQAYRVIEEFYNEEFGTSELSEIVDYIYKILEQVWLINIETESFESAMQIFETVNARGMRLERHDVYKSRIYKSLNSDVARDEFTTSWNSMNERIITLSKGPFNKSMGIVFDIYAHYLAALDGYVTTSITYSKKYFASNNSEHLTRGYLDGHYEAIVDFLEIIIDREYPDAPENPTAEEWWANFSIMKKLDILLEYYAATPIHCATIFYLHRRHEAYFLEEFDDFLESLLSLVLAGIFNEYTSSTLNATFLNVNRFAVEPTFKVLDSYLMMPPHRTVDSFTKKKNVNRGGTWRKDILVILKTLEYFHFESESLLPKQLEREHIVPMKWTRGYRLVDGPRDLTWKEADRVLGNIGNVTLFEKPLNIRASNDFFSIKKEHYAGSELKMTQSLAASSRDDFNTVDIENRRREIVEAVATVMPSLKTFDSQTSYPDTSARWTRGSGQSRLALDN